MNYINKIGRVAVMAVAAGCASNQEIAPKNKVPVVEVPFVVQGRDSGHDFLKPAEAYSSEEGVLDAIEKMREKIFRAGGEAAEQSAVENCDNGVPGLVCMMEEGMHSIQGMSLYSKALSDCYSGPMKPDGSIDPNGFGNMDLECMLKLSPAPEQFEAEHMRKMLACRRDVLACFQQEYRGINGHHQASN